jgi:catechol 2,3-dioxygenase-like lactoylglutathione lyase family enzyme
MTKTTALFPRIDTVFLPVRNLQKAVEWYTTTLGFTLGWVSGEYGCLRVGETPLTLYETQDDSRFPSREHAPFNFFHPNAEEARATLLEKGVEVGEIQHGEGVRWFHFFDLDGNRLEVCTW